MNQEIQVDSASGILISWLMNFIMFFPIFLDRLDRISSPIYSIHDQGQLVTAKNCVKLLPFGGPVMSVVFRVGSMSWKSDGPAPAQIA